MKKILFILILAVVAFGVVNYYPSLFGKKNTWNPHLEGVTVSTVGEASYTKPVLEGTVMTDYTISFEKSGDAVTFQFKLVNDSELPAKLASIVKSVPRCKGNNTEDEELVCDHLTYSLMNEDGTELAEGVIIPARSHKKVKLMIGYTENEELEDKVTVENLDVDFLFKKEV